MEVALRMCANVLASALCDCEPYGVRFTVVGLLDSVIWKGCLQDSTMWLGAFKPTLTMRTSWLAPVII